MLVGEVCCEAFCMWQEFEFETKPHNAQLKTEKYLSGRAGWNV